MQNHNYLQSQAILTALEFALANGAYGKNAKLKRAAQQLARQMKSMNNVSGRQAQLVRLLRKGATIEQMMDGCRSSRRTIFRYLNHFEENGHSIHLEDGVYRLR